MNKTINQDIIEQLAARSFSDVIREHILPLLQNNIERIEFVKDSVGLRDILYFEEEGLFFHEIPLYLSVDCKTTIEEGQDIYDLYSDIYENAVIQEEEIINGLTTFFQQTNRILYVEIAFEENILKNGEMWDIFHQMKEDNTKEPLEFMIHMYKFPDWYQARHGEEIKAIDRSITAATTFEKTLIKQEISNIKHHINHLLLKGKFDKIKTYSHKVQELENQLK